MNKNDKLKELVDEAAKELYVKLFGALPKEEDNAISKED